LDRHTTPTAGLAATLAAALMGMGCVNAAEAATTGVMEDAVTATTARWGAVAVAPGAAASQNPHVLVWTVSGNQATARFEITNVGDLELVSQQLGLAVTVTQGGSTTDPIGLSACIGATWDAASDTCSGTIIALGTSAVTPIATGLALSPGGRVSVRAATTRTTSSRTITAISVVTSRIDGRAATTTSG
jgi:hypothetical protein